MARPRVGDQRREQILAAFEACVVRNGLEKTTLDDVARAAGQPRPLVRYFAGNRAELVSKLIDRIVKRSEDQLRGLRARCAPGARGEELVELLLDDFFSDRITNRIIPELWHMSVRSRPLRRRLTRVYHHVLVEIAEQFSPETVGKEHEARFDAVYAAFALALGASVLKHLGVPPSDPARLLRTAKALAADSTRDENPEDERRGAKKCQRKRKTPR
jgi:AcrR family transcriptional regulator